MVLRNGGRYRQVVVSSGLTVLLISIIFLFQFSTAYKSEVIKNNLSPTWKPFQVKVRDLCNADYNRPLKIDIYDWDSNGKHDIIGTIKTNLQEIRWDVLLKHLIFFGIQVRPEQRPARGPHVALQAP